jgi:membrane protein YqaA with SNARE-associated domain
MKYKYIQRALAVLLFMTMVGIAVGLWRGVIPINWLSSLGYKGIFVLSFLNGVAPVAGPSQIVTFFAARELNPLGVGIAAGIGGAIGELATYVFGHSFRESQIPDMEEKFQRLMRFRFLRVSREHSFIPLFVLAGFPNPFFKPACVTAGILKVGLLRYFLPILLAKTLRHVVIAYAGFYSIHLHIGSVLDEIPMTEFLNSSWFVVAVFGIGLLVWSVRSVAESEPDPFVLNFTFFAFAGQLVVTAELWVRQDKVNATVAGLALFGLLTVLVQILVFRDQIDKTTEHYKTLLQKYKPDKYNDAEIDKWAEVIVRITSVDFWPQLYRGLGSSFSSGPRGRRRRQALMVLNDGGFKCGEGGITADSLTVPEDERRWSWRFHAGLFLLSWAILVWCINAAKRQ